MLWALLHPKLMKTHTKSKCHVYFIKIKPLSKYFLIWSDIMSALRHGDPEVKGLIAGLRTLSLSFTLLFVVLYESWHKNRNKTDILDKSLICFTYQHAMLSCFVFPSLSRLLSDDLRLCNYDSWGQQGDRRVGCLDRLMRCKIAWWSLMFDVLNKHVRGQLVCLHYAWIRLLRRYASVVCSTWKDATRNGSEGTWSDTGRFASLLPNIAWLHVHSISVLHWGMCASLQMGASMSFWPLAETVRRSLTSGERDYSNIFEHMNQSIAMIASSSIRMSQDAVVPENPYNNIQVPKGFYVDRLYLSFLYLPFPPILWLNVWGVSDWLSEQVNEWQSDCFMTWEAKSTTHILV